MGTEENVVWHESRTYSCVDKPETNRLINDKLHALLGCGLLYFYDIDYSVYKFHGDFHPW